MHISLLSDEARSTNDIYEQQVGTEEIDTEEIDTEDIKIEQDIQGLDPGDVIAEEIPLMQTYTRDIEGTLE